MTDFYKSLFSRILFSGSAEVERAGRGKQARAHHKAPATEAEHVFRNNTGRSPHIIDEVLKPREVG